MREDSAQNKRQKRAERKNLLEEESGGEVNEPKIAMEIDSPSYDGGEQEDEELAAEGLAMIKNID